MSNDNDRPQDLVLADKDISTMERESVQARARDPRDAGGFLPLLTYLARSGEIIPAWWSQKRDEDLDKFWKSSDHVSGAFYTLASKLSSVPFYVQARDPAVKQHRKLAEEYQEILESGSEFGQGWQEVVSIFLMDLWTQDNGGFFEIIGGGNKGGPRTTPAVGLAHLDSRRCVRTGNPEFPVIYQDTDGRLYRLHRSRVEYRSQLPSARAEMYRVGFCWLSRCINVAQNMVDTSIYKQEKLGSRPQRFIAIAQGGLDPDAILEAFAQAGAMMDAQGLSRFSKGPIIGDETIPDADLSLIDLASLPDGFDYETDTQIGMFTIALTGAVPPRWLWPATTTGATKADAMFQHVSGLRGGPGATLKMLAEMLGGPERGSGSLIFKENRFLPPQLKMVFDFQDDEQDRMAAEISKSRSEARDKDVNNGVITVRVAREQMVEDGELTEAQFEELELGEGRLPDGSDVLTLFASRDGQISGLLAIDAEGDPLDIEVNDATLWLDAIEKQIRLAQEVAVNGPNAKIRRKARWAIAAMEKLRELYKGPEEPAPPTEMEEDEVEVADEDTELEDGEKSTNLLVDVQIPDWLERVPFVAIKEQVPSGIVDAVIADGKLTTSQHEIWTTELKVLKDHYGL